MSARQNEADGQSLTGEPLTVTDEVFLDVQTDQLKRGLTILNDSLHRLVTLNAAMLGGLVFLGEAVASPRGKWTALALFFAALLVSLWAMLPYGQECPFGDLPTYRRQRAAAIGFKNAALRLSAILMFAGLLAAMIGVACH